MNPDRRDNASFALVGVQMCLDRRGKGEYALIED